MKNPSWTEERAVTTAPWLAAVVLLLVGCGGETDAEPTGGDPDAGTADVMGDAAMPGDGLEPDTDEGADTDSDADSDTEDAAEVTLVPQWTTDPLNQAEEFVLRSVWGPSPDRLFVVGNKATIVELEDGEWRIEHQNLELDTLNAVWGTGPDDVWAVGAHGAILHRDADGWNIGAGCSSDAACDDGDSCTVDVCGTDGQCLYEGSGEPGCCGSVAWTDTFEGGLQWTVTDLNPPQDGVTWQVVEAVDPNTGAPRATSGTGALYFGNPYATCDDGVSLCPNFDGPGIVGGSALSPLITVPDAAEVTASFQVFLDGESSGSYDTLDLVVLSEGQEVLVWTKDAVGGSTAGAFVPATADLSNWQGKTIQVRFDFDSADSAINDGEGAYVDDFRIDTACGGATTERFPTLWDVWGTGPDNVYAVGNGGTIVHWDGESWKVQLGGAGNDMIAVTGNADGLVAGGAGGEVITNFGGGLSLDKAATSTIRGMATRPDGATVAVGDGGLITVRDESGWTPAESGTVATLHGVWSGTGMDVAVGDGGLILQGTGGTWTPMESAVSATLYDVWGPSDDELYAVGEKSGGKSTLTVWDGTEWTDQSLSSVNSELRGITGFTSGLRVAVGGGGTIVERQDGVWTKLKSPTSFVLHAVWGTSEEHAWAVGNIGSIVKRNNGEWENVIATPTKVTLYDIWGRSETDVYVVGNGGAVLRWDGTEWILLRSSTEAALRAVWGTGPDNIFAVGSQATIMHFDGLYWSQVKVQDQLVGDQPQPVLDQLNAVWGSSPDDIYAVGATGTIVHYTVDEASGVGLWVKEPQPDLNVTLRGATGDGADTWFVGRTGSVLHYAYGQLTPEHSGSIATLYDVIGFGDGRLVAVGDLGTVIRRELVPAQ